MKKIALFFTFCIFGFLAGCLTNPPQPIPPAQLFAQFCITSQTINTVVLASPDISPDVTKSVTQAQAIVSKVCASGVTLNAPDLQTVLDDAVPLLSSAVAALPPDTPNLAALKVGVSLAPIVIPQIIENIKMQTAAQAASNPKNASSP